MKKLKPWENNSKLNKKNLGFSAKIGKRTTYINQNKGKKEERTTYINQNQNTGKKEGYTLQWLMESLTVIGNIAKIVNFQGKNRLTFEIFEIRVKN